MKLIKFLIENNLTVSMSDGKRIVFLGGVKVNGEKETDFHRELMDGDVIEFRKQEFIYHTAL